MADTIKVNRLKRIETTSSVNGNMEQLSGVMIIIIIGGGILTFLILFIFAKRQIVRFTLRSRRGPHVPIGTDAKKSIRREIERRLDCIQKIAFEPRLIWDNDKYILRPNQSLPPYYYRMQAVDDVKLLEKEIAKNDGGVRHPHDSLRAFLLTTLAAPLSGPGQRMIHQFCDMYEHARHDPNDFGSEEYESYHRLLLKLMDAAKMLKSFSNSRKTSPSRTPGKKKTKMHSLLDPSRLRPPPINSNIGGNLAGGNGGNNPCPDMKTSQSKLNLALSLQQQSISNSGDSLDEDSNSTIRIRRNVGGVGDGVGGGGGGILQAPSIDDEDEILSISQYPPGGNESSVV